MNEKIVAVIVTYNPDISRFKKNILSIYKNVEMILIIDNNSNNRQDIINILNDIQLKNKFKIIKNKNNIGISGALNQGIEYSNTNGYSWILTLDQDSVLDCNMLNKYYEYIKKNRDNLSKIGIISPNIIDENLTYNHYEETCEAENIFLAITSGSLININIAKEIGGFVEELFIDYVDFEYCLNLNSKGYKIVRLNDAKLYHQLGSIKTYKILKWRIISTNHNYLRRYYYFRNRIYVYKKYIKIYPKWVIKNIFSSIKTLFIILIFESDKYLKFKFSMIGIKDGILNNYGRFEDK